MINTVQIMNHITLLRISFWISTYTYYIVFLALAMMSTLPRFALSEMPSRGSVVYCISGIWFMIMHVISRRILSLAPKICLSSSLILISYLSLSSSFPFVRGEVLPATFPPPHLIVFSTLLCLLSSSSSLPPRLPSSHLS